jgi:hypothetical protein
MSVAPPEWPEPNMIYGPKNDGTCAVMVSKNRVRNERRSPLTLSVCPKTY